MKIVVIYKEPDTNLKCYQWREVFDEKDMEEAVELLDSIRHMNYELKKWALVHDEDVWKIS